MENLNEEVSAFPTAAMASQSIPNESLTLAQQEAVAQLQGVTEETILAWRSLLKSLISGYQYNARPGGLTPWQFDAINALLDVNEDSLLAHFQAIRSGIVQASTDSLSDSFDVWSPSIGFTSRNTSDTSWGQAVSSSNIPALTMVNSKSSSSLTNLHSHWCPHCGNRRPITTCDGWKRHMKEHDTVYPCMPSGPLENTDNGLVCALCHKLYPDQAHLDSHNILACEVKPKRYTRRGTILKHLASQHGIFDGSALADRWRVIPSKKYFSCGFCVSLFHNIGDQLNHIDNHFKIQTDISEWQFTKVILGLLLQPGVDQCWSDLTALHDTSCFSWSPLLNRDLQGRLELGEEPARKLAVDAWNESFYDDSLGDAGLTMS